MKKFISIFVLSFSLFASHSIFAATVEWVSNPRVSSGSFVGDEAGVLGPEYISLIDSISKDLETKTSAELAVITVDDLGGMTVEEFAEKLFKRFGIGKKGKDNGLLILFALNDRKVRIEVGYGLEATINDAKAGRFLDTYAIPKFKQGEYGRGLYDLTRAVAEEIAKASGVALGITEPATWPEQVEAEQAVEVQEEPPEIQDVSRAVLIYVIVVLAIAFIGLSSVLLRVKLNKAKAAKKQILGRGAVLPVIALFVGAVVMFMIAAAAEKVIVPLVGYLGTGFVVMFSQIMIRRRLERYIKNYRLDCPKCKAQMDLVDEISDDKFLTEEETAEEQAKGMDYEFWKCPECGSIERFSVKLHEGSKCPKCNRRSLKKKTTTLFSATTSSSGKERIDYDCQNPKCGYHTEKMRTIPRVGSSSGGSSGFSSGGSSFGGGSSGGGGSSRGW